MNRYFSSSQALVALVILTVIVVGAGCVQSSHPSTTTANPVSNATTAEDGGKQPQIALINIFPRQLGLSGVNLSNESIEIHVFIKVRGYSINYDKLRLCAYTQSGSLLQGEPIGNISVSDGSEAYQNYILNYTSDRRPHYIIVDHPRLRNDSRFRAQIRVWSGDGYTLKWQSLNKIQNRFEWPRTNEPGKCG